MRERENDGERERECQSGYEKVGKEKGVIVEDILFICSVQIYLTTMYCTVRTLASLIAAFAASASLSS